MISLETLFYRHLIEAVGPEHIGFVRGKRDMQGHQLSSNKLLASLFSQELDKVGKNPDKLSQENINRIYNHPQVSKGLKGHMDGMAKQFGNKWYKPQKGYKFSGKELQGVQHISLAGDARLVWFDIKPGNTEYFLTTHQRRNGYAHVAEYVKLRKSGVTAKKARAQINNAADQPKKPQNDAPDDGLNARARRRIARGNPPHPSHKPNTRNPSPNATITKKVDSVKMMRDKAKADAAAWEKRRAAQAQKHNTMSRGQSGKYTFKNPSAPKQGRSMEVKKDNKPGIFARLKKTLGMK